MEEAIRIVDNSITGTLRLNWVGPNIEVRGNDVGDLRVNENNARWGDPTAGTFVHNTFRSVGQLRHFDGMFMYNTVGAPQSGMLSSKYPDVQRDRSAVALQNVTLAPIQTGTRAQAISIRRVLHR